MEGPEPGFPRETDSRCPTCITEERDKLLQAPCELSEFVQNSNGRIEDVISIDPKFNRLQEQRYYGRGAVLNIDLTNRCNMMCSPCFTDANQIGHPRWTEFGVKIGILAEPTSAPLLRRIRS